MTLEETLSKFAEALEMSRATNWYVGDMAAEAVKNHSKSVIGKLAETARCSCERIRQLICVSKTFGEEVRYPDADWSIYRAVYHAANRTKQDPVKLLIHVFENDMSLADIAAIGTNKKTVAKLSKQCDWCNAKVSITAEGLAGTKVSCPVCLATNEQLHTLGVLSE